MKRALQIPLTSIPDPGKELHLELGPEWFARWRQADPDLEFDAGEVAGTVRLGRHGRDILVRGELASRLTLTCSRCLEAFQAPLAAGFDLLLVPASPEAPAAQGEELSAEDLDVDFYSGEVVDLENLIREQIILAVPLKPLCTEDCRGLCPRCGANLNRESCGCPEIKPAGPLAGLAKLKV